MNTSRLEAFSDGVLAIAITIMVLELRPPAGAALGDLVTHLPKFIVYLFSFLVIAIYWNNHHHLLKSTEIISPAVMWANMHLLFWLSLIPFATAWIGEPGHWVARGPVVLYAGLGFLCGFAYYQLSRAIIRANPNSAILKEIGEGKKGVISVGIYVAAIAAAFIQPIVSLVLIVFTAVIWFIPDRRFEQKDPQKEG